MTRLNRILNNSTVDVRAVVRRAAILSRWSCQWDVRLRAELEQVYRQHRQALFSLALSITGCSGLAEDAVHQAFVRLCDQTERPSGRLSAYVFAAVRNAAVDQRRHEKRQRNLAESLFADTVNSGNESTVASQDEQRARLQHEIQLLDEDAREIFVMKIFGELTFDEIGIALNTPAATVATKYRRTLAALEEKIRRDP